MSFKLNFSLSKTVHTYLAVLCMSLSTRLCTDLIDSMQKAEELYSKLHQNCGPTSTRKGKSCFVFLGSCFHLATIYGYSNTVVAKSKSTWWKCGLTSLKGEHWKLNHAKKLQSLRGKGKFRIDKFLLISCTLVGHVKSKYKTRYFWNLQIYSRSWDIVVQSSKFLKVHFLCFSWLRSEAKKGNRFRWFSVNLQEWLTWTHRESFTSIEPKVKVRWIAQICVLCASMLVFQK